MRSKGSLVYKEDSRSDRATIVRLVPNKTKQKKKPGLILDPRDWDNHLLLNSDPQFLRLKRGPISALP